MMEVRPQWTDLPDGGRMQVTFTNEARDALENLGWRIEWSLATEVAVRRYEPQNAVDSNMWNIINPDGSTYSMLTGNLEEALGSY